MVDARFSEPLTECAQQWQVLRVFVDELLHRLHLLHPHLLYRLQVLLHHLVFAVRKHSLSCFHQLLRQNASLQE